MTILQTDHAIIDDEQFETCLAGEPDMDRELVELAITQWAESMLDMEKALAGGDEPLWMHAAHRARGLTGTMGFAKAAALWDAAERHTRSIATRTEVLEALEEAFREARVALRERGYELPA